MNPEISEEVFTSFFLNLFKNRNSIFTEIQNTPYKNKYTYRLQELVKDNESILRQFFNCPTFLKGKKIISPFYFMPYKAKDKNIICRSTENGQAHIYARQSYLENDIVEQKNLYIRLSTRIYDGDICFNNSEILNITKVSYYVFFYKPDINSTYIIIVDIKKFLDSYTNLENTKKEHKIITKDGRFILSLYSFNIEEMQSKNIINILIKGTDIVMTDIAEGYCENKKFNILNKEVFSAVIKETAFLLPDKPTKKIYFFYNIDKKTGKEFTIQEIAEYVCSKNSTLEKKSVISELYRVARKQQEQTALGQERIQNSVLNQNFYIFENKEEFEDGISTDKKIEIENRIIDREEKKLKYKGKYVKKDAIRKWLKRHNNEFNSKWTEEEKLIAEEIIKKWNSK